MDSAPLRALLRVARALDAANLDYAVGGSVASTLYGEARSTFDVDILVDLPSWRVDALVAALGPGFDADRQALLAAARAGAVCNVIDRETGIKVDFFVMGDRPLEAREMHRRRAVPLGEEGATVQFYAPEDLILRKLEWLRRSGGVLERQMRDVVGVLKVQGPAIDLPYLRETAARLGLSDLLARALVESGLVSGDAP